VSIYNRSRARLVDSSRNRTFSRGYPNLMHSYGGLLVPRGSKLALLQSTFNAENYIRRLSWSISRDFDAVYFEMYVAASNREKKSLKPIFWGSWFFIVIDVGIPERPLAVHVMIRRKSVSICNRSLATLDDSSRNRAFWRGYPNLMDSYGGLLEPRGQTLHRWNLRLMPNILCARCPGLSWMVSAQFTLKMCIAAWNREKLTKTPISGVQGRSRSSMLVPLVSSSAVLVIRSKSVSICNRSNARRANSGKITIS